MYKPFDTHAHINDSAYLEDFNEVLKRSLAACGAILNIGCETIGDFATAVHLAQQHKAIFAAIALHPENADQYNDVLWQDLMYYAKDTQVRAIGETGLDYHWMTTPKEDQIQLFCQHIELAKSLNKPIIIHNRDAHHDTLKTLWQNYNHSITGVFHAYSGSVDMMKEIINHDFYIGLGGVVTFKNAKTAKEVAQKIPLTHLVLETDCPYMTPTPHRGKRNEPAYVAYIAQAIADLRHISVDEVLEATWKNSCNLYQLDPLTLNPL